MALTGPDVPGKGNRIPGADIRAGRRRPHPRHWLALAELVGIE